MKHIKIKKITILVFGFWSLVFGLNLTLAQEFQQPPPYPTEFWIIGKVTRGAGVPDTVTLEGWRVIFYKNRGQPSQAYALGITTAAGDFLINAHADLRLLPLTAETYYLGIASREVGGVFYGKNETPVTLEVSDIDTGYKNIGELALASSEGAWVPTLEGMGVLKGIVYDAKEGGPIGGAVVSLTKEGYVLTAISSSDGSYLFSRVTPETYTVVCTAKGYYPTSEGGVQIYPETILTMNLGLIPIPTGGLRGRVVSSEGTPVGNTEITIWVDGMSFEAQTDENGYFTVNDVPKGSYIATVGQDSETKSVYDVVITGGETTDIGTVETVPGGTLRGVLADESGKPLVNKSNVTAEVDGKVFSGVRTDGQGRFAVDGVGSGEGRGIVIKVDGLEAGRKADVVAGKVTNLGTVEVHKPAPAGTVYLKIFRNGGNIEVKWEKVLCPNPKIFVLTGDGTGSYINTYEATKWIKVAENGGLVSGVSGFQYSEGVLTHEGQVGDGSPEVYYKAVFSSVDPSTPQGAATFESAPAVGKVNVGLENGWNLVGIPFDVASMEAGIPSNLNAVLGQDGHVDLDQVWVYDGGFTFVSFRNGSWPTSPAISLVKGKGLWMYMNGHSKVLTLVGPVFRGMFQKEIAKNWNLLSAPYPYSYELNTAESGLHNPAYLDQIWSYRNGFSFISATGSPESWPSGSRLQPPGRGFWYYRNPSTSYNWQMNLP